MSNRSESDAHTSQGQLTMQPHLLIEMVCAVHCLKHKVSVPVASVLSELGNMKTFSRDHSTGTGTREMGSHGETCVVELDDHRAEVPAKRQNKKQQQNRGSI